MGSIRKVNVVPNPISAIPFIIENSPKILYKPAYPKIQVNIASDSQWIIVLKLPEVPFSIFFINCFLDFECFFIADKTKILGYLRKYLQGYQVLTIL